MSKHGVAKGSNVDAVLRMPLPTDVGTLGSFMGSVQFYSKFLPPYLSTITEPLHKLTTKGQQWKWGREEQKGFERLKDVLCTDNVLAHYDPSLELGISYDVSKDESGAVFFHRYSDSSERPISNVSKTLTDMQRSYSQIHKEALAVVFAHFILVTGNKPCWHCSDPTKRHPF